MTEKRTYTIPLRREFRQTERYNKTKRATRGLRAFLQKHMKSDEVKIGSALNLHLWSRGGRNPPHKVVVDVEKNDDGVVFADLQGEMLPSDIAKESDKAKEKSSKKSTSKDTKKDVSQEKDTGAKASSEKKSSEKKSTKKPSKSTQE